MEKRERRKEKSIRLIGFRVTESNYICDREALHKRLMAIAESEGVTLSLKGQSSDPQSDVPLTADVTEVKLPLKGNVPWSPPATPPSLRGRSSNVSFNSRSLLTIDQRNRCGVFVEVCVEVCVLRVRVGGVWGCMWQSLSNNLILNLEGDRKIWLFLLLLLGGQCAWSAKQVFHSTTHTHTHTHELWIDVDCIGLLTLLFQDFSAL